MSELVKQRELEQPLPTIDFVDVGELDADLVPLNQRLAEPRALAIGSADSPRRRRARSLDKLGVSKTSRELGPCIARA